jgi:hypothetical protein
MIQVLLYIKFEMVVFDKVINFLVDQVQTMVLYVVDLMEQIITPQ